MKTAITLRARRKNTLIGLAVTFMMWACSEFLDPSVQQSGVAVLAPLDSARVGPDQPLFWWDPVPGASAYRMQIVKPSFKRMEELITDTLIKSNKMTVNLGQGQYQWRIRAVDDVSHTDFQTYTLFVDSASAGGRAGTGHGKVVRGCELPDL